MIADFTGDPHVRRPKAGPPRVIEETDAQAQTIGDEKDRKKLCAP
jgi:hypothetical protein